MGGGDEGCGFGIGWWMKGVEGGKFGMLECVGEKEEVEMDARERMGLWLELGHMWRFFLFVL